MSMNKKNKALTVAGVILALLIAFVFAGPFYTVDEGEQVVVVRFGEIVEVHTDAGLKMRIPFVDNVRRFSRRVQSWDGEPNRVPTSENQFIWVDVTARWRIVEPAQFYARLSTESAAIVRLDDLIDSAVRTIITDNPLEEAVRSSNLIRELADDPEAIAEAESALSDADIDEDAGSEIEELQDRMQTDIQQDPIDKGRRELADEMYESVAEDIADFGIDLLDVVIRQIRYSDELTESVYDRMVSERNQVAQFFRAFGEGQRERILGQIDQEQNTILSEAEARAQRIRGEADRDAQRLISEAYGASTDGFDEFWLWTRSYPETFSSGMRSILTTDSDYFRFLHSQDGQ